MKLIILNSSVLIRISWINSTRHSFWIVSCKGNSVDQVPWICRWSPVVFWLWQMDWNSTLPSLLATLAQFSGSVSTEYAFCLWSWETVSWPIRAYQLQMKIYSHVLVHVVGTYFQSAHLSLSIWWECIFLPCKVTHQGSYSPCRNNFTPDSYWSSACWVMCNNQRQQLSTAGIQF